VIYIHHIIVFFNFFNQFLYIRNFAPDRWPMGAPSRISSPP
jgi:hypothetical protein